MEICRKLDAIRTCSFAEGNFVPIAAPGDKTSLHDPSRPMSEPLPDFTRANKPVKERPGTAAADSNTRCRIEHKQGRDGGSDDQRGGSDDVNPVGGGDRGPLGRGSGASMLPATSENDLLGSTTTGVHRNIGEKVDSDESEELKNCDPYVDEGDIEVISKAAGVGNKKNGHTRRDKVRG